MTTYHGIGLMSGTSLDGVDIAYCQFVFENNLWAYQILQAATRPYSPEWRERLNTLHETDAETYARTDVEYGRLLGSLLQDFISNHHIEPEFVASHGHTVFHQPEVNFTAQVGDGETISAALPCPLVTNFRNKDVAFGGQGAPLVPFGEKLLFQDCRLFLNLGGFSNISADGCAFDVSPCNFALNWAAKQYDSSLEFDKDGELGRRGRLNQGLLEKLEDLEYYHRPPPKSLGREWFEQHFLPILVENKEIPPKDILHTLCEHIASRIADAVSSSEIRDTAITVTGGGARNHFLAELLDSKLAKLGVSFNRAAGAYLIDNKEALIFAFLGLQVLLGRPNILTSATGAAHAAVAGSIHLPLAAEPFAILRKKESR